MDPLTTQDLLTIIGDKEARIIQQQRYIHQLLAEIERLKKATESVQADG